MSFRVRFEAPARKDVVAAFEWYQARQSGLGDEFLRSVAAVEEALARNPERYALVHAPYRSVKLRKFPYGLHFRQSPERWPGA